MPRRDRFVIFGVLVGAVVLALVLIRFPHLSTPLASAAAIAAAGLTAVTATRSAEAARESRAAARDAQRSLRLHDQPAVWIRGFSRDDEGKVSVRVHVDPRARAAVLHWVSNGSPRQAPLQPGLHDAPLAGVSVPDPRDYSLPLALFSAVVVRLVDHAGATWDWTADVFRKPPNDPTDYPLNDYGPGLGGKLELIEP